MRGSTRRLDFPDGAGDQQADADAFPLGEAVVEDAVKGVLVGGYGKQFVGSIHLLDDFAAG